MSLEKAVEAWAGFLVLVSVALTIWVHPGFVWFTAFMGIMLFQQSFTGCVRSPGCFASWA
jgi:hypothetical protein